MLPVDPDIFDTDVPAIFGLLHRAKDPAVINGVLLERSLQPAFARAAGMEVRSVGDEWFGGAIRQAGAGEVRVIESQRQAGHIAHETQGGFWIWNQRTDVSFDAE